ncbi:MAG: amidohydrolase family protein, partial [Pseudomonadota bacterium]
MATPTSRRQVILILTLLPLIFWIRTASASDYTVVYAGRLMAVPGQPIASNQTIVIKDGVVDRVVTGKLNRAEVGASGEDTYTVHDLSDMFVMPGLIDGHVHLTGELGPRQKLFYVERSNPDVAIVAAGYARKTLMAGFTTVRDVGAGGGDAIFALRDGIARGDVVGPRVFASGYTISPTGGHGQRHGYRA